MSYSSVYVVILLIADHGGNYRDGFEGREQPLLDEDIPLYMW